MPITCQDVRTQALDYLYGAAEDDVAAAIASHAAGCPACRDAIAAAERERVVLAEAARIPAPDMRLVPPELRPEPSRRSGGTGTRPWLRIAAAVVAILGGGFAVRAWQRAGVVAQHPVLVVEAPRVLPADAPAEVRIRTTDVDGDPLPGTPHVVVRTATGAKLAEPEVVTGSDGVSVARIPADAGRPGERIAVEVSATFGAAGERRATTVMLRDDRRLLGRVSTDKPLYRPGEPIRVRSVVLERFRLTPAGDVGVTLTLSDPRGGKVAEQQIPSVDGVAAWEFPIDPSAPGGEWTVTLASMDGSFPEVRQPVQVRAYRPPRLKTDIELDRDAYGPGGKGEAWCTVARAEGGVPTGASCQAIVTVDGAEVSRTPLKVPSSGALSVPFTLPATIREGRGLLALVIDDGGTVETATKTIPITIDRLAIECFPESGDLVAGIANRVYVRVRDSRQEPADLTAEVVDSRGQKVADFRVTARGMGTCTLTPRAGERYRLVPVEPAGVSLSGTFPTVVGDGVGLIALDPVTPAGAPVRVWVASTTAGNHSVVATCRGVTVASASVMLAAGKVQDVALAPSAEVGGVFRVTVFDPTGAPRAERLVAVDPPRGLSVEIAPGAEAYAPGESVRVRLVTRDEHGKPARAALGITVTDEAMIALADDEDTADLPLHFLYGLEVDELEHVETYTTNADAARALDLLLGVQGWRRFAWKDATAFVAAHPETGARVQPVGASADLAPQRMSTRAAAMVAVRDELRGIDERMWTGVALVLALVVVVVLVRAAVRSREAIGWVLAEGWGIHALVLGAGFVVLVAVVATPGTLRSKAAPARAALARGIAREVPPEDAVFEEEAVPERLGLAGRLRAMEAPAPPRGFLAAIGVPVAAGPADLQFVAGNRGEVANFLTATAAEQAEVRWAGYWDQNAIRYLVARRLEDGENVLRDPFPFDLKVLVREFAHRRTAKPDGTRRDFAEVLYWHPLLVTDAEGKAEITFDTPDSITSFRIAVDAHDARGALAATHRPIRNRLPFYLEPNLPVALSAGDRLELPVSVANATTGALDVRVALDVKGGLAALEGDARKQVAVAADGRARVRFPLIAGQGTGEIGLRLVGDAVGVSDQSERTIPVEPRGYPIEISRSGVLEKRDSTTVLMPDRIDPLGLRGSLRLYPSALASMVDGLEGMLGSPGGCFEQASSTNYPNVMVLGYLAEGDTIAPAAARRAKGLLDSGYRLLTGYECKQKGYEWFGGDPGHEALTAYGLLEFTDMAKVHDVDPAMLTRTRDWLLARRDGEGGFRQNSRALDHFGRAPKVLTDAYILWTLTESSPDVDVTRELDAVERAAEGSEDPYLLALVANALANRGRSGAAKLLARLAAKQAADGSLPGAQTSITSSDGDNLLVETTALGALAFLRDPRHVAHAEAATRFILGHRRGSGTFGATQATVLALRALTAHAKASKKTATDHDLVLSVNGAEVAKRHIAAGTPGVITIDREWLAALRPGENTIALTTTGAETLPWALGLAYRTDQPPTAPDCAVRIETALARDRVAEGETVECRVVVRNVTDAPVPMVLARVGLPAGCEPRPEQLTRLREAGVVALAETRPREVTLYWRGLAAGAEAVVPLELVAAVAGTFEGPATSAYLYYGDDKKAWTAPLRLRIEPRD